MRKLQITALLIIIATFIIGLYFYPKLPDTVASHWNAQGQADGYSSKTFMLFFLPALMIGIWLLMEFIPRLDPLKKNVMKFMKYYDIIKLAVIGLLAYIYVITNIWNLGFMHNFTYFILPAFAVMFFLIGIALEKTKRNWFIGIRTPWAMTSDDNWKKTHRFGAKLFKGVAILTVLLLLVPDYAFHGFIAAIILMVIIVYAYSYMEYRKTKRKRNT
jgi:uncharacterized membrane protein